MTGMPHLLCLGCGYVATALGAELRKQGWQVTGTTRNAARAASLRDNGIDAILLSGTAAPSRDFGDALAAATHLLVSAAPAADGDPFLTRFRNFGRTPFGELAWIGYLSATSVYGDHGGNWVDERTEPHAGSARGRHRLQAEAGWRALAARHDARLQIFRLAGIYGPGRTPFDRLAGGLARFAERPGQVFSRIHRTDITATLAAALAHPDPPAIVNLADDEPATRSAFLSRAAQLLGIPAPRPVPPEEAGLSARGAEFFQEQRRVSNRLLKQTLRPALAFPTYREGLAALCRDWNNVESAAANAT